MSTNHLSIEAGWHQVPADRNLDPFRLVNASNMRLVRENRELHAENTHLRAQMKLALAHIEKITSDPSAEHIRSAQVFLKFRRYLQ